MTAIDFDFLEKNFYYFRLDDHPNKVYSIVLSNLNHKELFEELINVYGSHIKALNSQVVASYFCGVYGWFLAGVQYVLSYSDSTLNISLSNIELQLYYHEELKAYGICFRLLKVDEITFQKTERETRRNLFIELLYSENVAPLVNLLHTETKVRVIDLYGQLSIGLYHGYDQMLALAQTDEQKEKVQADFSFLTKELAPSIFKLNKNPLNITYRMIESPREEGTLIRMKPSCCLYYQTEGARSKCYGCPRLSDEERAIKKKEMLSS